MENLGLWRLVVGGSKMVSLDARGVIRRGVGMNWKNSGAQRFGEKINTETCISEL